MDIKIITEFKNRVQKELDGDIVPFWSQRAIDPKGGFIGRMNNDGVIDEKGPKGLILNTRILWTFSTLYCFEKKQEHLTLAKRAYDYVMEYFWDKQYGGMYWLLDWSGKAVESQKQVYGQGFGIYSLSEYYRASGDKEALAKAMELFGLLDKYVWDKQYKGYFEKYDRDWTRANTQQLTSGDMAAPKSMNTSLHMLEGIANLYDVNKDELVGRRVGEMLDIFADFILHPYGTYCQLFFDEKWYPKSQTISFGHDIETAWLAQRDAEILGKPKTIAKLKRMALKLTDFSYKNSLDNYKSMFYEAEPNGVSKSNKDWWVQAEAVVGYLNAYQLTGDQKYFDVAQNIWQFIEDYIVDKKGGEWFWAVDAKGNVDKTKPKVSEWKCPYHNSRACIEIIQRLDQIAKKA
jgi:cellobiose epimerase